VIPLSQNRDEVFILPHGEELKHQVKYGNRFADEQTTDGMIFNENRLRQGNVQIRSHSAHQSKKKKGCSSAARKWQPYLGVLFAYKIVFREKLGNNLPTRG
jgi:hypothetical protein